MTLDEYLSVPYMLVAYSARRPDGEWVRCAEYPELGCVSEGATPIEALDRLDAERIRFILEHLEHGEPIPVPRPPLRSQISSVDLDRLGFAKWLVEHGRVKGG